MCVLNISAASLVRPLLQYRTCMNIANIKYSVKFGLFGPVKNSASK